MSGSSIISARSTSILQIHWTFPPTTGGVESHLFDLAEALVSHGCRVAVLTGETKPLNGGNFDTIATTLLDLSRIRAGEEPQDFYCQFRQLVGNVVAKYATTIIHAHNLHHFHSVPALVLDEIRRTLRVRVHHTFHETWPDLLQDNPVYRRWEGNYAVSRFVRDQCHSVLGFRPSLLPLGVNTALFKASEPCMSSNHAPVILHPARLLPWKGVEISVRALRLLHDFGHRAHLILTDTQRIADWNGELDTYRTHVVSLVERLGLQPYVRFEDVPYSNMPQLYRDADIVVYPTIGDEPFGLVPIEAMSSSRPIVASRSGGITETVIDGITGYIVPRGDAKTLADRLCALIENPSLARQLGAAGRRHVEKTFDGTRYVTTLLQRFSGKSRANAVEID